MAANSQQNWALLQIFLAPISKLPLLLCAEEVIGSQTLIVNELLTDRLDEQIESDRAVKAGELGTLCYINWLFILRFCLGPACPH